VQAGVASPTQDSKGCPNERLQPRQLLFSSPTSSPDAGNDGEVCPRNVSDCPGAAGEPAALPVGAGDELQAPLALAGGCASGQQRAAVREAAFAAFVDRFNDSYRFEYNADAVL
jgi:hypothetical protein